MIVVLLLRVAQVLVLEIQIWTMRTGARSLYHAVEKLRARNMATVPVRKLWIAFKTDVGEIVVVALVWTMTIYQTAHRCLCPTKK
jgi:hypothetical protein